MKANATKVVLKTAWSPSSASKTDLIEIATATTRSATTYRVKRDVESERLIPFMDVPGLRRIRLIPGW
jgi:hypothetical protein